MSSKVQSSGSVFNKDSTAVLAALISDLSSWTRRLHTCTIRQVTMTRLLVHNLLYPLLTQTGAACCDARTSRPRTTDATRQTWRPKCVDPVRAVADQVPPDRRLP